MHNLLVDGLLIFIVIQLVEMWFDHACNDVYIYFSDSFREIGQKSSEELARDGSGVKAFASFLSELGALVPELMIPNISVLITHLEGEVLHP